MDNGQKTRREPGTDVGQSWGGGTEIRTPSKSADIDTESYVGGISEETGEDGRDSD